MKYFFANQLGKIRYAGYEWLIMRVCIAAVALRLASELKDNITPFESANRPAGLGQLIDLDFMGNDVLLGQLQWVFLVLTICYVLQWVPSLASFGMLVIYSLGGAFLFSNGAKPHHLQIVSYLLIGQIIASVVEVCRKKQWLAFLNPGGQPDYRNRCVFYAQQMFAACYVITGLTKVVASEGRWIVDSPNLVVQFEKNLQMAFYNTLIPPDERATQWTIDFMTKFPCLGMALFGGALLVELLAFLALWNRALMLVWGIAIVLLHQSIGMVMNLKFVAHEQLAVVVFVNAPFWVVMIWKTIRNGRTGLQS